ncbi:MAG: arginase family protein, partial [Ferruginibacter sp.]
MLKIIGIPYDENSSFLKGPALAPSRIRLMEQDGSANKFSEDGKEILKGINYNDLGDIFFKETDPQ